MPGGVAGARPVKVVPYADAWNLSLRRLMGVSVIGETNPGQWCLVLCAEHFTIWARLSLKQTAVGQIVQSKEANEQVLRRACCAGSGRLYH